LQFAVGHGPIDSIPSVGTLCVAWHVSVVN